MSDSIIVFTPQNPRFIPYEHKRDAAIQKLMLMFPNAEEVNYAITEGIQFIHCGSNFERVSCPFCDEELDVDWWQAQMDTDYVDGRFELSKLDLPCCGEKCDLNQLKYSSEQAFGCFTIEMMNEDTEMISATVKSELEDIIDSPLTIVYRHL